jgi:TonB family protein
MTPSILTLAILSVKVALLGALLWIQLYFLRRGPAGLRSRLCVAAIAAIPLLAALQALASKLAPSGVISLPLATFRADALATNQNTAGPADWLLWTWMAGVAVMLARMVVGRVALARLRRKSELIAFDDNLEIRAAAVQTPILVGLLSPAILVPGAFPEWTESQREMVLLHERQHFRYADHWSILLAQMVRAVLWFHPAVWMLAARLSREQELACDESVIAAGYVAHEYATFLLTNIRALRSADLVPCAMAGSGADSVKHRFARLLQARPVRIRKVWLAASLAVTAAFVVATLAVSPGRAQEGTLALEPVVVQKVYNMADRITPPKLLQQPVRAREGRLAQGPVAVQKTYKMADGITAPKVLHKVEPKYTQEAKDAKIEGAVVLKVVVTSEGKADNIEVVKGLDPGLDQSAMDAVAQWEFQPGTKDGQPVNVAATIEVNFRLM